MGSGIEKHKLTQRGTRMKKESITTTQLDKR